MSVFVDTSALIALLDREDPQHARMRDAWRLGFEKAEGLLTTNYVVLESCAVVQRRFGTQAVRDLLDEIVPLLHVEWIDEKDHAVGATALMATGRRQLSLVDCVSFAVMRRLRVRECLATDPHFAEQGFAQYSPQPAEG
jgi:predicted nucleic acid-binding protein